MNHENIQAKSGRKNFQNDADYDDDDDDDYGDDGVVREDVNGVNHTFLDKV